MNNLEKLTGEEYAEAALVEEVIRDFSNAVADSEYRTRTSGYIPIYHRRDDKTDTWLRVEALGYSPTKLISDVSTVWSAIFRHEDGEESSVLFFGGRVFDLDDAHFVSQRSMAPELLKTWQKIDQLGNVPQVSLRGGGIGEQNLRTDRIPTLGRLAGRIVINRWHDWVQRRNPYI